MICLALIIQEMKVNFAAIALWVTDSFSELATQHVESASSDDEGDSGIVDAEQKEDEDNVSASCLAFSARSSLFQLIVDDVTTSSNSKSKSEKGGSRAQKILVSDFENTKLAVFAKRCARMATCIDNMCPEDNLFAWPIFTEEMERLNNEGRADQFLASLAEINEDPNVRDNLVRFVSDLYLP
jgi:hypothetical protein